MIAFEIPYPATKRGKAAWNKRFGLNAYYAGKHWSQRKKDAEELHELAHWAMRKAGITKCLVNHPVKVTFFWNDNLDVDNHGALGKAFVDAMKGYILPDDNPEWFRAVEHKFWSGDTESAANRFVYKRLHCFRTDYNHIFIIRYFVRYVK